MFRQKMRNFRKLEKNVLIFVLVREMFAFFYERKAKNVKLSLNDFPILLETLFHGVNVKKNGNMMNNFTGQTDLCN